MSDRSYLLVLGLTAALSIIVFKAVRNHQTRDSRARHSYEYVIERYADTLRTATAPIELDAWRMRCQWVRR